MGVKQAVREQYQATVNRIPVGAIHVPPEGWMRTVRKALGMSGAELARRMGVSRARIAQAERAELDGGVTLKSMQATAEAMGCRFVYAFEPPDDIENVIIAQARKKARAIVGAASRHMALEDQTVSDSRTEQEVSRLTRELIYEMPPDFWQDK
ncbi:mobile mystery protein A [Mesorhizobium mediterraneum]|uniref:mobile mystery protein A n=1 Tax=Mesorhizobium mediterraneum TaxID=43617 RepID=UPI001782DF0C|nr:mobile mystery protein A [Mesorhizobium mediterraneum]